MDDDAIVQELSEFFAKGRKQQQYFDATPSPPLPGQLSLDDALYAKSRELAARRDQARARKAAKNDGPLIGRDGKPLVLLPNDQNDLMRATQTLISTLRLEADNLRKEISEREAERWAHVQEIRDLKNSKETFLKALRIAVQLLSEMETLLDEEYEIEAFSEESSWLQEVRVFLPDWEWTRSLPNVVREMNTPTTEEDDSGS